MELWAIAIATLVTALWLVVRILVTKKNSIPSVPGIPVLGNAIALGKGGLAFITQCRQKVRLQAEAVATCHTAANLRHSVFGPLLHAMGQL